MIYEDERLPDRFWDKCSPEPNTGCWLWFGSTVKSGHGTINGLGDTVLAHRISLTVESGREAGLFALHKCATPSCVNPDHLYWGTASNNVHDSVRDGTHIWARRKTCPEGHPYSTDNTYLVRKGKARICLTCKRVQDRERAREYRKRKANQHE